MTDTMTDTKYPELTSTERVEHVRRVLTAYDALASAVMHLMGGVPRCQESDKRLSEQLAHAADGLDSTLIMEGYGGVNEARRLAYVTLEAPARRDNRHPQLRQSAPADR